MTDETPKTPTLAELFRRNPIEDRPYTDEELERVIAYYRQVRDNPFLFKKDGTPKKVRAKAKPRQLDIEDAIRNTTVTSEADGQSA